MKVFKLKNITKNYFSDELKKIFKFFYFFPMREKIIQKYTLRSP